jgi:hypothetical protein
MRHSVPHRTLGENMGILCVHRRLGAIKCSRYGFNRPAARSAAMTGVGGQHAAGVFLAETLTLGIWPPVPVDPHSL